MRIPSSSPGAWSSWPRRTSASATAGACRWRWPPRTPCSSSGCPRPGTPCTTPPCIWPRRPSRTRSAAPWRRPRPWSAETPAAVVPPHLRSTGYRGAEVLGHGVGYLYPHDHPDGVAAQQYLPDAARGRILFHPGAHRRRGGARRAPRRDRSAHGSSRAGVRAALLGASDRSATPVLSARCRAIPSPVAEIRKAYLDSSRSAATPSCPRPR